MIVRIQLALLLALLLPIASHAQPAATESPDLVAQKRTVVDIRNVGTAMWTWYKDEVAPHRSPESHKKAEQESQTKEVDFARVPVISREELAAVLVPKYIAWLPEADGWGHPYEFRLNTKDANAIVVMAVRSAGKDGQLSGSNYSVGSFGPSEFDQDLAWMDGYFARWPEKKENGR
ncbi:MAG: hypothetical protein ABIS20_22195 [Thermoanaerobaculia bacterium]